MIDRERANLAFDIIKEKFYETEGKRHGLKEFP
jgi:hypothetical protein